MAIFSETKTRLSVEDFNKATQLLAANDRAGMYLLLAQKTGNPAYLNTAQISSGSGCLIGGPAIAINAYLQANYPDTYPKYSIADFSRRVADKELEAFSRKTDKQTGQVFYEGPSELGSYEAGKKAWKDAVPGHPELADLFPATSCYTATMQHQAISPRPTPTSTKPTIFSSQNLAQSLSRKFRTLARNTASP